MGSKNENIPYFLEYLKEYLILLSVIYIYMNLGILWNSYVPWAIDIIYPAILFIFVILIVGAISSYFFDRVIPISVMLRYLIIIELTVFIGSWILMLSHDNPQESKYFTNTALFIMIFIIPIIMLIHVIGNNIGFIIKKTLEKQIK